MFFKEVYTPVEHKKNLYYLAPIPLYVKVFEDDILHDEIYNWGMEFLTDTEKQMGQELPEQYDFQRQDSLNTTGTPDTWVESTDRNPIGSRYFVPPNNVLDRDVRCMKVLRNRIEKEFVSFIEDLGFGTVNPIIPESWMQYYDPYAGRGHNKHNHARWQPEEESVLGFSGGYYLSDGQPLKDHPYSGVFTFHVREISYMLKPKRGMLIMWPNDIVHSVKPFYGKTHRCLINFNIQA
jgi:hypothetical protein